MTAAEATQLAAQGRLVRVDAGHTFVAGVQCSLSNLSLFVAGDIDQFGCGFGSFYGEIVALEGGMVGIYPTDGTEPSIIRMHDLARAVDGAWVAIKNRDQEHVENAAYAAAMAGA